MGNSRQTTAKVVPSHEERHQLWTVSMRRAKTGTYADNGNQQADAKGDAPRECVIFCSGCDRTPIKEWLYDTRNC